MFYYLEISKACAKLEVGIKENYKNKIMNRNTFIKYYLIAQFSPYLEVIIKEALKCNATYPN